MPQFTKKVSAGSRVYFVDVRTDKKGSPYITVSELSKAGDRRSCVYLYKEYFDEFRAAVDEAIGFIESTALANVKAQK